jgi:DNA recombination protein RmuC
MLFVGIAVGAGLFWLIWRKNVDDARRMERHAAMAEVEVSKALTKAKDDQFVELQRAISNKEALLRQRDEEITQLKREKDVLRITLEKEQEKIEEKLALLGEAEKQFKQTFQALAADALADNTKRFDNLYSKPVTSTLEEIKTKIALVDNSATNLRAETSRLVKVLQKPDVRGQWGEMHLERVLEITGMCERCDYFSQHVIGDDDFRQRPDVVVRLPGDKALAVDAKATLQAFLDIVDAPDDEARQGNLEKFVIHVRERIKILGSKAYHQNLCGSPEFVVLYLPTEGLFSAALTLDSELLEFADSKRVLLAGPMNLIALLRAVAHGWKQDEMAKNAREICAAAEELYKRLATFGGHMSKIGKHLNESVDAYDAAVGSLDRNVMPQARRIEIHGAAPSGIRIPELAPIDKATRTLQSDEFKLSELIGEPEFEDALSRPR